MSANGIICFYCCSFICKPPVFEGMFHFSAMYACMCALNSKHLTLQTSIVCSLFITATRNSFRYSSSNSIRGLFFPFNRRNKCTKYVRIDHIVTRKFVLFGSQTANAHDLPFLIVIILSELNCIALTGNEWVPSVMGCQTRI